MTPNIAEETRPDWLGYDAHVARQRGFKARKTTALLAVGPLTAAALIGFGLGAAAMAAFTMWNRER
jgi:hypothetical protein